MSITNADHVCINCMREKADNGVCPFCGFDESTYEPSPHHLQPRSILGGKCLIGRVLGEGGFGITYMGWDLNLDLKLAIKEYYPTGFVTRTNTTTNTVTPYRGEKAEFFTAGRSRFINEAKTLAKFYTLPGIVSVRDFFLENGTAYIVMEFVEGETLKQRLARVGGKMEAGEVFDLVRPLLRSLAEMHATGLIHRDISPDNIMITPEGNVKLIDFGAARDYLDSGNRSLSVMLKPGYAPEEQYFARGQQGPWTDIYALCATLYRAITGQTPPESVERLRRDELIAPSALGAHISPAQEAALLKGLAVTQEDRWQSIPELNQALYQGEGLIELKTRLPESKKITPERSNPDLKQKVQKIFQPIVAQFLKKPSSSVVDLKEDSVSGYVASSNEETTPSSEADSTKENSVSKINIRETIQNVWNTKRKQILISLGALAAALILFLCILLIKGIAVNQRIDQIKEYLSLENYDSAVHLIQKLNVTDDSYDGVLYEAARNFVDASEFEDATVARDKMFDADRFNLSFIDDALSYVMIEDYFSDDDPRDAVESLLALKSTNPQKASELVQTYQNEIYEYGVNQYEYSYLNYASNAFDLLPSDYERTADYLVLIQASNAIEDGTFSWDWSDENDADRILAAKLIDLSGFENAGSLLMENHNSAILFLSGYWSNGTQNFKIKREEGDSSHFSLSQNILKFEAHSWSITHGELFYQNDTYEKVKSAEITIIDKNTISIMVESSKVTYKLYRIFSFI